MKQKYSRQDPITKTVLQEELKEFLKQLKEVFSTKETLESAFKKLHSELELTQKIVRIETTLGSLRVKQEITHEIRKLHNEDQKKMDFIVRELETHRKDRVLSIKDTIQLKEITNKLERRIQSLESAQPAS